MCWATFKYLTHSLAEERLIAPVNSLAYAQGTFDITLEHIKERRAFGRPIGTFQNARFKIAKMRASLDAL